MVAVDPRVWVHTLLVNVQGPISERINGINSVSNSLISAMRVVLTEDGADGAFVAAAISLPTVSELIDASEGADPLLLHAVSTFCIHAVFACKCLKLISAACSGEQAPANLRRFAATLARSWHGR